MEMEISRISEKGQIVIPNSLRRKMKIKKSDQFMVFGEKNTIILKKIEKAAVSKTFDNISKSLRKSAKESGFSRNDLTGIIEDVRKNE